MFFWVYYTIVLKAQNVMKGADNVAISIKAARINAGKTLAEVAECTEKTKNTIASYESYRTTPDINTAQIMAKMFGMTIDQIKWTKE